MIDLRVRRKIRCEMAAIVISGKDGLHPLGRLRGCIDNRFLPSVFHIRISQSVRCDVGACGDWASHKGIIFRLMRTSIFHRLCARNRGRIHTTFNLLYHGSTEDARRFPLPEGAAISQVAVHRGNICSVGSVTVLQRDLDGGARSGCPTGRLWVYAQSIIFMPSTGSCTATNNSTRSINKPTQDGSEHT